MYAILVVTKKKTVDSHWKSFYEKKEIEDEGIWVLQENPFFNSPFIFFGLDPEMECDEDVKEWNFFSSSEFGKTGLFLHWNEVGERDLNG